MIKVKSNYAPENLNYLLSRSHIYPPIKVIGANLDDDGISTFLLASDWLPFDVDNYYELIFTTVPIFEGGKHYTTWTIRKLND